MTDDQMSEANHIEPLLRGWGEENGFRADHALVWHRSPDWLDSESHEPGKTWREGFRPDAIEAWS